MKRCGCRFSRSWWKTCLRSPCASGDLSVVSGRDRSRTLTATPFAGNQIPDRNDQPGLCWHYEVPLPAAERRAVLTQSSITTCRTSRRPSTAIRAIPVSTRTSPPSRASSADLPKGAAESTAAVQLLLQQPQRIGSGRRGSAPAEGLESDWRLQLRHHAPHRKRASRRMDWICINYQLRHSGVARSRIKSDLAPYIQEGQSFLQNVNTTPNVRITGFQRTGGVGSNSQQTQTYQFLDNVTMTEGKHTYKFGADYRYLTALYTSVFDSLWLGRYNFTSSVHRINHRQPVRSFPAGRPKQRHHRHRALSRHQRLGDRPMLSMRRTIGK